MNFENFLYVEDKLESFKKPITYINLNVYGKKEVIYTKVPDSCIDICRLLVDEIYRFLDSNRGMGCLKLSPRERQKLISSSKNSVLMENVRGEIAVYVPEIKVSIKIKENFLKLKFIGKSDEFVFKNIRELMDYVVDVV